MYNQLIAIFLSLFVAHVSSECRRGWIHFERSCYFFSSSHKSWADAASFCIANHAELAVVESKAENVFIADIIRMMKNGITKRGDMDGDFWIDGTDETIEGVWSWASTGKPLTYSNWIHGTPDNSGGNENCLEIVQWDNHIGQYNDDVCSDESHFICETEYPASGDIIGK